VGGIIIFSEEITNRKQAEEALNESRERLSLALASSGAAVFEWDMVNNKRFWDENVHRLLGTDPMTFKGTTEAFLQVIHPEDREAMRAALGAVSETGRLEVEYRAVLPNGNIRHVASRGKVQRDGEGRALRLTGVTWDITARKKAEEEIRMLNQELESRVVERTSELMTAVNSLEMEIGERHRLEREILEISEREKARVGQDLHDGVCQELAGIAFLAKALKRNLEEEKLPAEAAAEKADEIANLLRGAIEGARGLATGMYPVSIEESGLAAALEKLAGDTAERFHVGCKFQCRTPVVLADNQAAAHVYRITQEAVGNAIRHGRAKLVVITLAAEGDRITLRIEDNGGGRLEEMKPTGMGLKTMNYRARSIGGELEIQQRPRNGIAVVFSFPNRKREG
jgi:PAS domain S-box-containing protein